MGAPITALATAAMPQIGRATEMPAPIHTGTRYHRDKTACHGPGSRADKQCRRENPAKQAKAYADRCQAELGYQQHSKEHRAIAAIEDDGQRAAAEAERLRTNMPAVPVTKAATIAKAQK